MDQFSIRLPGPHNDTLHNINTQEGNEKTNLLLLLLSLTCMKGMERFPVLELGSSCSITSSACAMGNG